MFDNLKNCFICLKEQSDISLLYTKITAKDIATQYLPKLIEEISGVKIRLKPEKEIIICNECAKAILQAEATIKKCRESHTKWLEVEGLMLPPVAPKASNITLPKSAIDDAGDWSSEEEEEEAAEEEEEQIANPQTTNEEVSILPDVLVKSEYCITEDIPMEEDTIAEVSQHSANNEYHEESNNSQAYVVYDVAEEEETDPIVIRYRRLMETRTLKKDYIFNCEHCNYTTTIAKDFMEHTKSEHNIVNNRIFKCNICGNTFTLFYYLQGHVRQVHESKHKIATRAKLKPQIPKNSVRCKVCSKILSKTSIHRHMRTIHASNRKKPQ